MAGVQGEGQALGLKPVCNRPSPPLPHRRDTPLAAVRQEGLIGPPPGVQTLDPLVAFTSRWWYHVKVQAKQAWQ